MLIESGIDADAAEHDGRLGIIEWEGAYLVHGRFDQQSMLEFAEAIGAGREKTGAITRIWADMAWAAREIPGVLDLAEYECRLNHILPKYDMAVVCAYDVSKFDSTVMWNVLRAHPQIIIGGKLAKNPFYVLPDALLREFGKQ
jgi:hypothetical protein